MGSSFVAESLVGLRHTRDTPVVAGTEMVWRVTLMQLMELFYRSQYMPICTSLILFCPYYTGITGSVGLVFRSI